MADRLNRFLGDTPLRVFVKLVLMSLVAGFLMHMIGFTPVEVLEWLYDWALHIWSLGFEAFDTFFAYILLGGAVVVPLFFLIRILKFRG